MPNTGALTAREMEVLALAWQCMDAPPKIDFNKLAKLAGYAPASASVTFGNIKRKLRQMGDAAANGSSNATPPRAARAARAAGAKTATPKSTGKRGAKAIGGDDEPATPGKKPRMVAVKKQVDEDEDEEFKIGSIKKEEVTDLQMGMNEFLQQVESFAHGTE